ncbi:NlpC/P60 family protein [Agriterribacter sp.]|uniref:C40 family peptidase n=1 Tax=Agriterribacter sp. TaxID=2821509 RepID=UPI002B902AE0|nr:NlpC/P60 family protein [Agriterribacter sp.]HRO47524.1 NlpC/P60 family protein [Agriterribacter sp.]HRQ17018.1 NlpC/P60 family protein [Agriterribacter sp.]
MRYLLLLVGIAIVGSSCSSLKSTSRSAPAASRNNGQQGSPKFLNDITITTNGSAAAVKRHEEEIPYMPENYTSSKPYIFPAFTIEQGGPLQFKYAIKMDVEVERLANRDLYKFIESWWGTPYRMGGATQRGVDCSAFTQTLISVIYGLQIPRTASEQKVFSAVIGEDELREGDLVFFNTRGRGVSHVGIYLQDNKFVHAASSGGVMISSLNETYWHKRLISAGRVVDDQTAAAVSLHSR